MISSRCANDAAPSLRRIEPRQSGRRAADFERTRRLHRFELQKDIVAALSRQLVGTDERAVNRDPGKLPPCLEDSGEARRGGLHATAVHNAILGLSRTS